MSVERFPRRTMLGLLGASASVPVLSACGVGGALVGSAGNTVKVGLVIPQSGVYATIGNDIQRGWDLWLQEHGTALGGYRVITVVADEGETPKTGVPAVQRVLQTEQVDIVVGIVNSSTALAAAPLVTDARKLLVVANAGAADITESKRSPYVWRTSFQNAQVAAAAGTHLVGQNIPNGVFVIAPDCAAGAEVISGFQKAYEGGGGKVVGVAKPPFGTTQNYGPFLDQIRRSGAGGIFGFFAGVEAVRFVTQYYQSGLAKVVPLYGSGFLTEGVVLTAQGDASLGVQTALHYTDQLDNPANRAFSAAYQAVYDTPPTCYAVQGWDTAIVLDRALRATTGLGGDAISAALGNTASVDDSPRGPWSFDGQSPKQTIYLRTVQRIGDRLANAVTSDLGAQSQI